MNPLIVTQADHALLTMLGRHAELRRELERAIVGSRRQPPCLAGGCSLGSTRKEVAPVDRIEKETDMPKYYDHWGAAIAGSILLALPIVGAIYRGSFGWMEAVVAVIGVAGLVTAAEGFMRRNILRGDGLVSAALLGLPVMELVDARGFASLAAAIIVAVAALALVPKPTRSPYAPWRSPGAAR